MVASLRSSGCATIPTINVKRSQHIVATERTLVLPGLQESEEAEYKGASHLWILYFLRAYNGLMALPILESITTFEVMV
ncbi:hypothetical protein GIB67_019550 [Kingdonia uniflora]|uniref:Uncharacterized protein n=1 Tax=Kingdonia uniflora TaxID=39325 RepID=A0A7J7N0R3_9MAGN|nr:hypothetical protein GIB67_019550 [Kingdonia uniflora]